MHAIIEYAGIKYTADLMKPMDISIPMVSGSGNPNAFGIQAPEFKPFEVEGFIGSVALGGSVNCENLLLNAHGNGTHTECVGHISSERITINQCLQQFFAIAQVVSISPDDHELKLAQVKPHVREHIEALIIRTLPNSATKTTQQYSGNHPAFLEPALCQWLAQQQVSHLLIDLPSVDPEVDGGKLSAHHAFWQYPEQPRMHATISEMIYVPDFIPDGLYLLNIQIASLETDASPSKPVLYALHPQTD